MKKQPSLPRQTSQGRGQSMIGLRLAPPPSQLALQLSGKQKIPPQRPAKKKNFIAANKSLNVKKRPTVATIDLSCVDRPVIKSERQSARNQKQEKRPPMLNVAQVDKENATADAHPMTLKDLEQHPQHNLFITKLQHNTLDSLCTNCNINGTPIAEINHKGISVRVHNQAGQDLRDYFPKSRVRTPHISCGQNAFQELQPHDVNVTVRNQQALTKKGDQPAEELSLTDQIQEVIEMALKGYNRSKQLESKSPGSIRAAFGQNANIESVELKNLISARETVPHQVRKPARNCSCCQTKEAQVQGRCNDSMSIRQAGQSTTRSTNYRQHQKSTSRRDIKSRRVGQNSSRHNESESFNFEKAFQEFQTTQQTQVIGNSVPSPKIQKSNAGANRSLLWQNPRQGRNSKFALNLKAQAVQKSHSMCTLSQRTRQTRNHGDSVRRSLTRGSHANRSTGRLQQAHTAAEAFMLQNSKGEEFHPFPLTTDKMAVNSERYPQTTTTFTEQTSNIQRAVDGIFELPNETASRIDNGFNSLSNLNSELQDENIKIRNQSGYNLLKSGELSSIQLMMSKDQRTNSSQLKDSYEQQSFNQKQVSIPKQSSLIHEIETFSKVRDGSSQLEDLEPAIDLEIEEMANAIEGTINAQNSSDYRSPKNFVQQNQNRGPSDYFLPQPTPCFDEVAEEHDDPSKMLESGQENSSDQIHGIFLSRDSDVPSLKLNSHLEKDTMLRDTHASISMQQREFETARAALRPALSTVPASPFSTKQASCIQPQDAAPRLTTKWNPVQMQTKSKTRDEEVQDILNMTLKGQKADNSIPTAKPCNCQATPTPGQLFGSSKTSDISLSHRQIRSKFMDRSACTTPKHDNAAMVTPRPLSPRNNSFLTDLNEIEQRFNINTARSSHMRLDGFDSDKLATVRERRDKRLRDLKSNSTSIKLGPGSHLQTPTSKELKSLGQGQTVVLCFIVNQN